MSILGFTLNGKPAGEVTIRPTIPLDRALLCLDCEAIFEAEGAQRCPACASERAWAIARALNRPATPAVQQEAGS